MPNQMSVFAWALPAALAMALAPVTSSAAPAVLTPSSIESAFSGELSSAAGLLAAGDAQGARRALAAVSPSAPKRVLEMRLLSLEGDAAAAGGTALSLRDDYPLLADHWAFQAAALFRKAEQADRASKRLKPP